MLRGTECQIWPQRLAAHQLMASEATVGQCIHVTTTAVTHPVLSNSGVKPAWLTAASAAGGRGASVVV